MAKIFISYSRSDKPRTKNLTRLLRDIYGDENVWWDEDFLGGQVWWVEILKQIAACDVFVFLMSPRSLGSPYCLAELEEARRLHKAIIPVKFKRYTDVPEILRQVQYIELVGSINYKNIAPLRRAITSAVNQPRVNKLPLSDTPVAAPIVPVKERPNLIDYFAQIMLGIVVTIVGGVILAYIIQADRFDPSRPTEQATSVVEVTSSTTNTPVNMPIDPLPAREALTTAVNDPFAVAERGVTSNAEWTPYIQAFNGVEMVLVPVGCFDMGSNDSDSDEQPVYEICFDAPFWIDRYEVSNEQFAQFNGVAARSSNWTDASAPRESITWFEARDFCDLRDARLPTEAEWEYAARGSDNLIFPWGNVFVIENVVYSGNSGSQTANIGSRPTGISWVSALDMSGNVWEWVSTIHTDFPYPYATDDGREDVNQTNARHVLRGGSWNDGTYDVRAARRGKDYPADSNSLVGVRCARSL